MEQFLLGKIPIEHLLDEEKLFISWRRYATKKSKWLGPKVRQFFFNEDKLPKSNIITVVGSAVVVCMIQGSLILLITMKYASFQILHWFIYLSTKINLFQHEIRLHSS